MDIKLYTTHCPMCRVLQSKLDGKDLNYERIDDVDLMIALGIHTAPALQVDDGPIMNFAEAYKWVQEVA